MKINILPQSGNPFSIEVGNSDSILEIKQRIERFRGTPAAKQTFIFSGKVLENEHNIAYYGLFHLSLIQLIVAPDEMIQLQIQIPSCGTLIFVEMNAHDTIASLKQQIQEMENSVHAACILCHTNGVELLDEYTMHDYNLTNNQEIMVSLKPSSTASSSSANILRLTVVLCSSGHRKIPVKVNALENVGELRKELERLQLPLNFRLPPEGYFFIHKQDSMEEENSFFWHKVNQGDTIAVFSGYITDGTATPLSRSKRRK